MTSDAIPVGLVLGSHIAPELIPETARLAEELGFAELWLAEDYWFTGAISGAAAALAATERIPVGLGIVSALVRHPSLLAMEVSTLSRIHPGRFWPGIGLGLPAWLDQMGLRPGSQLAAMRECVTSLRRLLEGEVLTEAGREFRFDGIKLTYPLEPVPPIAMGVLGPKMLQLAGEVADGTVGSVLASAEYIRWAREQIRIGQERAGRSDHHRFAAFAMFSIADDAQAARDALRPLVAWYLATVPESPLSDHYGITDQLVELAQGGPERVAAEMPDTWLDDLAVVGSPEDCARTIRRFHEAGADSVVLFPAPVDRAEEIVRFAGRELLPLLR